MSNDHFEDLCEAECGDVVGGIAPLLAVGVVFITWTAKDILDNWKIAKQAWRDGYADAKAGATM